MRRVIKRCLPGPLKRWLCKYIQPEMLRRKYIRYDYPAVVGINFSSSRCFLKCRMCPQYNYFPGQGITMDIGLFKAIVGHLAHKRGLRLELASFGETLTTKNWREMIKYVVENKNVQLVFVTNGALLNKEARAFLIDYPPDVVQVSIDAATPRGYRWLTGGDNFEKAAENLRLLSRLRDEKGMTRPRLHTHIIACKEMEGEIGLFIDTWRGLVDAAHSRPMGNWGGVIDDNGITPLWSPPRKRYPCFWPFYAMKIMPDGEVHKCHVHFLSGKPGLGFIQERSIEEIWRGRELSEVRANHLEGAYAREPMCEKCNVWALIPNIWRRGEYRESDFTGRRYAGLAPLYP